MHTGFKFREFSTTDLHGWVDRYQQGDQTVADELLRHVAEQLERMARKMLRTFSDVARWEQTDDVLQNATLRLLVAMKEAKPASVRAFFGLAAEMMRRELLDMARAYRGPHGWGANHASVRRKPEASATAPPVLDPPAPADDADDFERWTVFHDAVARLPENEREVVSLIFYHGWTRVQIAQLLQVNERTVRRHWRAACQRLHNEVKGQLPQS